MSISTPWGQSDHRKDYGDGLAFFGTPGHGGVRVLAKRVGEMHPAMQRLGIKGRDGCLWFEEDCAIAAPIITFRTEFAEYSEETTIQSLKNWSPDEYAEAFDVVVKVEESGTLQRRKFETDHKDDLVVISAVGIDGGMVACTAVKGGRMRNGSYPPGEPLRKFIVPKKEYGTRSSHGFIIDPERHLEEKAA